MNLEANPAAIGVKDISRDVDIRHGGFAGHYPDRTPLTAVLQGIPEVRRHVVCLRAPDMDKGTVPKQFPKYLRFNLSIRNTRIEYHNAHIEKFVFRDSLCLLHQCDGVGNDCLVATASGEQPSHRENR